MRRSPIVFIGLVCACSDAAPPAATLAPAQDACAGRVDGVHCSAGVALTCEAERERTRDDCAARDEVCSARGCVVCEPGRVRCDGAAFSRCASDGSAFQLVDTCAEGTQCSPNGCRDLCGDARRERSYLGCTYFPALPINSELHPEFTPAIVVGNPNLVPARVTLERAGERVAERTLAPGTAESIELTRASEFDVRGRSLLARSAAYALAADVPVTVQQWNPLEFARSCTNADGGLETCGSVTNDAALLVPAEALTRDDGALTYLVATRPTFALRDATGAVSGRSGFVLIVGASEQPAHVEIHSTSHTAPSAPGTEPLPALAPGDTLRVTLAHGDVLQLLSAEDAPCAVDPVPIQHGLSACHPVAGYDLSGTEVRSDAPVTVVSGHDCTNIPYDRPACDHLEESLVPVDTWGTRVIVPEPRPAARSAFLVQVVSADDDNLLTITPSSEREAPRLARGESFTFDSLRTVEVSGTGRLLASLYLQGQGESDLPGDPSMTLATPSDQWRSDYAFLTPATYERSYATFVGRPGTVLVLDERRLAPLGTLEDLAIGTFTQSIERAGSHRVHSEDGSAFGVQLYGVADYTSYMCPGGLDLRVLPEPG